MKRKVLSVLLASAMLAAALTGCGSAAADTAQASAPAQTKAEAAADTAPAETQAEAADTSSGEAVTLKWAIWDKDITPYWVALKEAYEEANPNVTIEMTDLGSTDYMAVLATELSGSGSDFDAVGIAYPTNDMTFEEYDALARKISDPTFGFQIYGTHYHTWRSAVQLFGVLDGKHSILDGEYDFFKPYYEMVLQQEDDQICRNYADLSAEGLHYSAAFSGGDVAMMNMGS